MLRIYRTRAKKKAKRRVNELFGYFKRVQKSGPDYPIVAVGTVLEPTTNNATMVKKIFLNFTMSFMEEIIICARYTTNVHGK